MELGQTLKAARLAAGLSQRQLCGDRLTRNMLSRIENGSARPSMATLEYLAGRLGLPMSHFWQASTDSTASPLEEARAAWAAGALADLRRALDRLPPEQACDPERQLLEFLWRLAAAEEARNRDRLPYARALLEEAAQMEGPYLTAPLTDRCRTLLALAGAPVEPQSCDQALQAQCLRTDDPRRQLELLAACRDRGDPQWQLLSANALFSLGRYREARSCYEKAPPSRQTYRQLELCCRELEDYKEAYRYACAQREEHDHG